MKPDQAKRLNELELGNARLKRLLAGAEINKTIAGSGQSKLLSPQRKRQAVKYTTK